MLQEGSKDRDRPAEIPRTFCKLKNSSHTNENLPNEHKLGTPIVLLPRKYQALYLDVLHQSLSSQLSKRHSQSVIIVP